MKVIAVLMAFVSAATAVSAAEPGSFFTNGPRSRNEVALTFDDGPGSSTEKILEVLRRYGVRASFFAEGSQVAARPAIAKKIADEGHDIYSHLYSHPNFYAYEKNDYRELLAEEMDKAVRAIEDATGTRPKVLRMPHGYVRKWVREIAREKGYVLVNWTYGYDWHGLNADQLAGEYGKNILPGAIFLMHDGGKRRQATVEALPKVIEIIQKKGYKIVPLSVMLGIDAGSR